MPAETDLPPSLSPLAFRNAVEVDQGRDFHVHVDRLIRGIEFHLGGASSAAPSLEQPRSAIAKPVVSQPRPVSLEGGRANSISMVLVRIEPGSFLMGSTKEQIDQLLRLFPDSKREWFDDEQPQHQVEITRPFMLGAHPVTQGQYQAILGSNPSHFKGSDDLPVESVSWLDAVTYCNRLSERENRGLCYRIEGDEVTVVGGNGYRLPTEAEWEYACRAGNPALFPFGADADHLGEHAWYASNSGSKTHPMGQRSANAWRLYDMIGNVWEWCADWYDGKYYDSAPPSDPPGAAKASYRVVRGGSWDYGARRCRPAYRGRAAPGNRGFSLGFRVAGSQE